MLLVLSGLAFGTFLIDRSEVRRLSIRGELDERQRQEITALVSRAQLAESSNAAEIKARFDAVDWIHHTSVRRDWPDGLILEVFPEAVIAYWNDDAFISETGKVLVTDLFLGSNLPYLYGPPGSEYQVMAQYQALSRALVGIEDRLEVLRLAARGSWEFETRERLHVLLGKEDIPHRMHSFLTVRQALRARGDLSRVDRMDARYTQGVAVHYRPKAPRSISATKKQSEWNIADGQIGRQAYE